MKYQTIIDPENEELLIILAHQRTALVEEPERLAEGTPRELIGYEQNKIFPISPADVDCFLVEENKVYALTEGKRLWVRERLYRIGQMLGNNFVRIHQSCVANIKRIERFEVSFAGALLVVFRGGHRDYASRRQLKIEKERIGFRL